MELENQKNISQVVETPDYADVRDSFCKELRLATQEQATSLPFIHNAITTRSHIKTDEIFQVFVIGGTNSEIATLRYNADKTISIIDYRVYPNMAKFESAAALLKFIDKHVDDITNTIGINFAFGLQPQIGNAGQMDGTMIGGDDKGHTFEDLRRQPVGETIEQYFMRIHNRPVTAAVANDIVCLIASVVDKEIDTSTLVAGIVGTGYNMAFFLDTKTIVNVQAAAFSGFKPTTTGHILDRESSNIGAQLFEKEVAAGELYKHYNILAKQYHLEIDHISSTKELSEIAGANQHNEGDIARALFKRSASLLAAQFAGFYNFKGRPRKLTAIMQGSLFWQGSDYKEVFVQELIELGVPTEAIVFEALERSGIIGITKLLTGTL